MRIEKINNNNIRSLSRKYEHNYRTTDVPNADKELSHLNEELVSLNGKTYTEAINERINSLEYYKNHKVRKDNVIAFEILTTFSKENNENINIEEWKKDNVKWLEETFNINEKKYGNNVLSVMYHGDESGNVHCHAIVTPIDQEGKLNSKTYTGGRLAMINLQTSYAEKVGKKHNLERGIKGSSAKHKDIKLFYTALNNNLDKKLPEKEIDESMGEYYKRINEIYQKQNLKIFGLENKIEQLKTEKESITREPNIDLAIEKYVIEHERDIFERKFGDIEEVERKIKTVDLLDEGLKNHQDKEFANQLINNIDMIIKEQKERNKKLVRNKNKKKEK